MAFDFPASPTEGQIYSPAGGPTYVFNSPTWKAVGQGQIAVVSDAAPASPANGQLWWESDTGLLFIYVNDGNSSQWVQCGGIAAGGRQVTTFIITSQTYTKPEGLQYLEIELQGGGGGGGGAPATAAGQAGGGGGGGGGGYAYQRWNASELPASFALTVGAAGAGAVGVAGATGGSTVAAGPVTVTASGGVGGISNISSGSVVNVGGSAGGTVSGGIYGIAGKQGQFTTLFMAATAGSTHYKGGGGDSKLGWGGIHVIGGSSGGGNGILYGGGAAGDIHGASTAATIGGSGAQGCIVLKEYF